ncbi:uncharacterized protein LOC127735433 isoform X2 [Mytilus californianus]|uniref:uncharacterized protein LOC127735433 isoform X2 n=1 Tax=Mytilus californianus TaxID=6549 RepID=UPI002248727F|nr:uncharacterized protein LOC127735433 isoform X2 [Mytilus californianus]
MAFQKAFISFALVVCLICPVCVSQLLDGCDNRPKDIVFILDASSSIWPVDFHTQLKFLQNLTKTFNIGPSDIQTRVGIVTFSNSWKVEFHLNEKMNKPDLAKAIRRVRHLTGGTNTADAINFVADNMFLPENGARHDSTKIVIVITDGESYYKDKTAAASKKLREKDVSVFAIGVGSNIDLKELESIASDPSDKYVLEVLNYRGLKRIESILRQRTCEVTMAPTVATSPSTTRTTLKPSTTTTQTTVTTTELPTTKEPSTQRPEIAKTTPDAENLQADRGKITKICRTNKTSDIMFVFDSAYYGYKMSNIILDLIQQVSMYLATTGGKIKTGIQSNSCLKDSIRQLSADPIEVVQDYDALPQLITDLRIKQFMSANGGRGTSTKMAVVFVDNTLSKTAKLQVLRSKFRKINFIFVQIGNEVMDKKLQKLAGKAHYVVALQSDSHTTAQHLNTLLCEGI